MKKASTVFLALHYQNENCHPDGQIKVGMPSVAPWREERLGNAKRLMAGCRAHGVPVIHVRLAVRPDYADVVQNTPIIREWVSNNAWREGTWGGHAAYAAHVRNIAAVQKADRLRSASKS